LPRSALDTEDSRVPITRITCCQNPCRWSIAGVSTLTCWKYNPPADRFVVYQNNQNGFKYHHFQHEGNPHCKGTTP